MHDRLPTVLITLRLWAEPLDNHHHEWRGEIKNVATGEVRYFRRWEDLPHLVPSMLHDGAYDDSPGS